MILEAREREALREVLVIASALSVQDVRDRPLEQQQAADQAHAKFDDEKSRVPRHAEALEVARAARAAGTASTGCRSASRSSCCATTSSRRAACASGATSTRSCTRSSPSTAGASTRTPADLRAAAPVDARRPARQHRAQERRGRVVPRRARHPLLAPSRARTCRRSRGAGSSPPSWSRRRGCSARGIAAIEPQLAAGASPAT